MDDSLWSQIPACRNGPTVQESDFTINTLSQTVTEESSFVRADTEWFAAQFLNQKIAGANNSFPLTAHFF